MQNQTKNKPFSKELKIFRAFAPIFATVLLLAAPGCQPELGKFLPINRSALSWTPREMLRPLPPAIPEDLDHDGRDELIGAYLEENNQAIVLYDNRIRLIDEVRLNGSLTAVRTMDWDGDGEEEIVCTFTEHDSAFLRVINSRAEVVVSRAYLFHGRPRRDSTAVYPWRGAIRDIRMVDLNGDGGRVLAVLASEGFSQSPRGIFFYNAKTLQLERKYEFGPFPVQPPIIEDVNGDGKQEIFLFTSAPCNGNRANGTRDTESYIFCLTSELRPLWQKKMGGRFSGAEGYLDDVEADGRLKLYALIRMPGPSDRSTLLILDPVTGERLAAPKTFSYPVSGFRIVQWNRDLPKEYVVLGADQKLRVFDAHFKRLLSRKPVETPVQFFLIPDIDGDGFDDVLVQSADEATYILDHRLRPIARFDGTVDPPDIFPSRAMYYQRPNQPPLLLIYSGSGTAIITHFYHLRKNPGYWIDRYAPLVILVLLLAGIAVIGVTIRRRLHDIQYFREINIKAGALSSEPVFVLDHQLRIRYANAAARRLLGVESLKKPIPLKTLARNVPELFRLFSTLRFHGQTRFEKDITLESLDGLRYRMIAEPVRHPSFKAPFWMIIFSNLSQQITIEDAQTWAAMAQRIAHDIKNPLTSIQLTVQRMQLHYRRKFPDVAPELDPYVERILERIDALRQLSRGFMKLVHLEDLNLQTIHLNQFVRNFLQQMDIPGDITVKTQFSPELPTILFDPEQLQSVLQNLISNAINAMPDGGTITITTSLAKNIRLKDREEASDYVVLEILDTGTGIPEDIRQKLFKPFASATRGGTGLGLAIVKRILDQHGAHIEFETETGVGTSFTIYFSVKKTTGTKNPGESPEQTGGERT